MSVTAAEDVQVSGSGTGEGSDDKGGNTGSVSDAGLSSVEEDGATPGDDLPSVPDDSEPATPDSMTVSGSVGDGPVIGATVVVTNAGGVVVAETTSGPDAAYTVALEAEQTDLPLTVTVRRGIDTVTGLPPDFPLVSIVRETGQGVANATPRSSIMLAAQACASAQGLAPPHRR